jgi:hypothetical protein
MKLGNRALLCDCSNSLVENSPYCDDCHHKDPSVRLDPSVTIEPTSTLDYTTDPSNTYIGVNKDNELYELQKKTYRRINNDYRNKPIKYQCDKYIDTYKKPNFTDPNTLYEKEYYNKNYLLINYDTPNNIKENFNTKSIKSNNDIIVIILILILILTVICVKK